MGWGVGTPARKGFGTVRNDDPYETGRLMSAPDRFQRPPLRYKRFGGGYRREDVEFALAELRLTLRQLENDFISSRCATENGDLEGELSDRANEIEGFRVKEHELSQYDGLRASHRCRHRGGRECPRPRDRRAGRGGGDADQFRGEPPIRGPECAVQRARCA